MENNDSIKMRCKKCGYEWITASDKLYVSCPNCLSKVKKEVDKNGTKN